MWNPFNLMKSAARGFQAAGRGRRVQAFVPSNVHINQLVAASGNTLTARARYQERNDAYAGNAAEVFASTVVGDGIRPRPKLADKSARENWVETFVDWVEQSDADGMESFYGQQDIVARETFVTGECFVRFRQRRPGDMDAVPLQLQILPSEMLDLWFNEDLGDGRYIKLGIEFNAIGKRLAYHFFKEHPGDIKPGKAASFERVRVPARDVLHIMDPRQSGQIRGVTRFARTIIPSFMLSQYDDSEMDRKHVAASFSVAVTQNETPVDLIDDEEDGVSDASAEAPASDTDDLLKLGTGTILRLRPGEDAKPLAAADVGGSYDPWQYRQLTRIASGYGVPYAYMTGDTAKGNFSNTRTDITRFRRTTSSWTKRVLIHKFVRPVVKRFHETALLSGHLAPSEIPKRVTYLAPRQEYLDPLKDVKALREEMDAKLKTRTRALAERGEDIEDVDRELEAESTA